jgi:hypothetical protein
MRGRAVTDRAGRRERRARSDGRSVMAEKRGEKKRDLDGG